MHENFPDWYREVGLSTDSEVIERRSQGIDGFIESAGEDDVLGLVRLMCGLPSEEEFQQRFGQAFRSVDASFPMRDNEKELSALAAGALAELFGKPETPGTFALLATVCGSFLIRKPRPPVPEVLDIAEAELCSRCAAERDLAPLPTLAEPTWDMEQQVQQLKEQCQGSDLQQIADPLTGILDRVTKACAQLGKSARELTDRMRRSLELFSEETNILWWVMGESSRDLGPRIVDLGFPAACLVVGKELGDLVAQMPGPAAAEALLSRMLHSSANEVPETVQLEAAVSACPREWREAEFRKDQIDVTGTVCPVHLAAKTSLTTDGVDDWRPAYRKLTGTPSPVDSSPLEVAMQTYRESLLLKALQD